VSGVNEPYGRPAPSPPFRGGPPGGLRGVPTPEDHVIRRPGRGGEGPSSWGASGDGPPGGSRDSSAR